MNDAADQRAERSSASAPPADLIAGLVPTVLAVDLPTELNAVVRALGVPLAAFVPMPDGGLQADFELPSTARWRLWPDDRRAMWIGTGPSSAHPPRARTWSRPHATVAGIFRSLARLGVWPQEGRLAGPSGWSAVVPASALDPACIAETTAFGGSFSDAAGRAVRAVVFTDGRLWAEDVAHAERWAAAVWGAKGDGCAVS
jgi:hypothetical protein